MITSEIPTGMKEYIDIVYEMPKELKFILTKKIGIPIHFEKGLIGWPNKKDWCLLQPNSQGHSILFSMDGEAEFLLTYPICINPNYCISHEVIELGSMVYITLVGRLALMPVPLVINAPGIGHQIACEEYDSVDIGDM